MLVVGDSTGGERSNIRTRPLSDGLSGGFTFLGYWITERVTGVAPSGWEGFLERVARLYEQNAPQEEILRRIGQYVRRWKQWVRIGFGDVSRAFDSAPFHQFGRFCIPRPVRLSAAGGPPARGVGLTPSAD